MSLKVVLLVNYLHLSWLVLSLMIPLAMMLIVGIGVGDNGSPISYSIFLMWTASLALKKRAPTSASAVEDITALISCAM